MKNELKSNGMNKVLAHSKFWKFKHTALNFLFLTTFIFFSLNSFAQDSIVVKGTFIGNTKYAKVLMKKFGVGNFPIGGATIKDEKFSLSIPTSVAPGVYRFQYAVGEGEQYIDLIINGTEKEIAFTLQANEEITRDRHLYKSIFSNKNELKGTLVPSFSFQNQI